MLGPEAGRYHLSATKNRDCQDVRCAKKPTETLATPKTQRRPTDGTEVRFALGLEESENARLVLRR